MMLLVLLGLAAVVALLPLRNKSHQAEDDFCKVEYIECQAKVSDHCFD
jgi:hypothetical protein